MRYLAVFGIVLLFLFFALLHLFFRWANKKLNVEKDINRKTNSINEHNETLKITDVTESSRFSSARDITFQDILKQKGIKNLCHFTCANNLESIFKYGIFSRAKLDRLRMSYFYNDADRYDLCIDAICTSIEFPNYKMFYSYAKKCPDIDWVVLFIDANFITKTEFNVSFCRTNASSSLYRSVDIRKLTKPENFLEMFDEIPGFSSRVSLSLPDYYPTDPQAEVLLFGSVPTDYIKSVVFSNRRARDKYSPFIPDGVGIYVSGENPYYPDFFGPRKDYKAWAGVGSRIYSVVAPSEQPLVMPVQQTPSFDCADSTRNARIYVDPPPPSFDPLPPKSCANCMLRLSEECTEIRSDLCSFYKPSGISLAQQNACNRL